MAREQVNDAWPIVPLRQLLAQSEETTDIQPDQRYRQVTVRLWGRGVVLRSEVAGSSISAKRRRVVRAGQFVLSRIDSRNGAFGLVPSSLDGAVVSNEIHKRGGPTQGAIKTDSTVCW